MKWGSHSFYMVWLVARMGTARPDACVDHTWNGDWLPVCHRRSLHTRMQLRQKTTRKPAWTETRACGLLNRTRPRRAGRPPAHKPITQIVFEWESRGDDINTEVIFGDEVIQKNRVEGTEHVSYYFDLKPNVRLKNQFILHELVHHESIPQFWSNELVHHTINDY
jgi:hypothetical protein